MQRLIPLLLLVACSAACRAPMPSFNLLSPYGATRVPPPSTGSYGKPNPYYLPSTPQPGATSQQTDGRVQDSLVRASESSRSPSGWIPVSSEPGGVRAAVVESPVAESRDSKVRWAAAAGSSEKEDSSVRIVESGTSASSFRASLKGMPVNDASRPAEPQTFPPNGSAMDLSQLPRLPVGAQPATNPLGPSASLSTQLAPVPVGSTNDSASSGSSAWRAKNSPQSALRVAGR